MSDVNIPSCLISCPLKKTNYSALLNMNQLNYNVKLTLLLKM